MIRALDPFAQRLELRLAVVGLASTLAALFEGAALVVVVAVAADATAPTESSRIDLPLFDVTAEPGRALLAAAVAGLVMTALHVLVGAMTARLSTDVAESSRNQMLRSFLRAKWESQSQRSEGFLQESLSTLSLQSSALTQFLGNAVAAALSLVALLVASLLIDLWATLVVVALGAVSVALIRPVTARIRRGAARFVSSNSELEESATQVARLAQEIRTFGVADEIHEEMRVRNSHVADVLRTTRFASRIGSTVYRDVAIMFLVAGVGIITTLDSDQAVSVGAVIILIVRALAYATMLQSSRQQVAEHAPSLFELQSRLADLDAVEEPDGTVEVDSIGDISVEGVSYRYPDGRQAITDASFTIERGSIVGVVGPSGGGKSTMIQLLLRLRTPTSGAIRVDGVEYTEVEDRAWSDRVALVPQDPQLVAGTIAENVRFFRRGISDADVLAAARSASLGGVLEGAEHGLDSSLGPRGAGLSGGQRQRVAIARALVSKPDVIVLDEPTSALDADTEASIRATIGSLKGRATIVIAAHRPETLQVCDRLVSVDDGRVTVVDRKGVSDA